MILILLICLSAALVIRYVNYIYQENKFSKSTYAWQTNSTLMETLNDPGRYGEADIYFALQKFENEGAKFLFNLYIPKTNGQTTEIDVMMICRSGIFVYESKNYSGWIFGDEKNRYWYQTLPVGKRRKAHKEQFYNPVKQNAGHIKHLQKILRKDIPIISVIVFSDRCELKNIRLSSNTACVVHTSDVAFHTWYLMDKLGYQNLSEEDIDNIYNLLYPYTQADEYTKEIHVQNIIRQRQPLYANEQSREDFAFHNCDKPQHSVTSCAYICDSGPDEKDDANSCETAINHPSDTSSLICPLCGGRLILKAARRGKYAGNQFYGCSNFPRCRYIKNVNRDMTM